MKSESEVAQSGPTLSDPMDCSLPGSSAHGIFQAGVLEWAAIAFSDNHPDLTICSSLPSYCFPCSRQPPPQSPSPLLLLYLINKTWQINKCTQLIWLPFKLTALPPNRNVTNLAPRSSLHVKQGHLPFPQWCSVTHPCATASQGTNFPPGNTKSQEQDIFQRRSFP